MEHQDKESRPRQHVQLSATLDAEKKTLNIENSIVQCFKPVDVV